MDKTTTIAILGGTGQEGSGLALRLAHAGVSVVVGSRDAARAAEAAEVINGKIGRKVARGDSNAAAASTASVVMLTVPYVAQVPTALSVHDELRGKILIDATVPLVPPKVGQVQLPAHGSAVAHLQSVLGTDVRVVSAFQNVSSHQLAHLDHEVDCDVIVCGDDKEACETTIALAKLIGLRAFHGGPVCNSAAMEALTSVLIALNRRYKIEGGSGIRITGLPSAAATAAKTAPT